MQAKQLLMKRLLCRTSRAKKSAVHRVSTVGVGLLVMTGGVWTTQSVLQPQVAHAYKARVDVRLDRLTDETYQSMIRRAEIVARAAAQRSFDRDILMSEVSVMVIGEYQGTEAPLLMLDVSRQNWRNRPDTRRWAIYYRTAKRLLKLPSAPDPVIPNAVRRPSRPSLPPVQPLPQPVARPATVPVPAPATAGSSPRPIPAPTATPSAAPAKPDAQSTNKTSSSGNQDVAKEPSATAETTEAQ